MHRTERLVAVVVMCPKMYDDDVAIGDDDNKHDNEQNDDDYDHNDADDDDEYGDVDENKDDKYNDNG